MSNNEATKRPWRIRRDVWGRISIYSDANSQAIMDWLKDHPEAADKTFRGVTVCDSFGPKYNGSGDAFGPDEIISADESKANAELIVRAVNRAAAFTALLQAAKEVLAGLDERIRIAGEAGDQVPVFNGIADLHTAIATAEQEGREIK